MQITIVVKIFILYKTLYVNICEYAFSCDLMFSNLIK